MSRPVTILIVDDDLEIRTLLRDYLERHGYRVNTAADGKSMWRALDRTPINLIILDLMLPGDDGLVLCRKLRADRDIPVIMLTALGETTDRIVGLEMGADDYVSKPFEPRELLARIKAVLHRTHSLPYSGHNPTSGKLLFAGWTLDTHTRNLLSPEGVVVPLSGGEFNLLYVFLEHPNHVLNRDQLLELTRGREAVPFDRSIDVQVGRLRRRLGDDGKEPRIIKTVRNAGYVLAVPVKEEP
ncbi:MAG: response regulator [Gammaproteobacteria bacterium]|nr:response regulator [Gammaproteobacteria bacterium]